MQLVRWVQICSASRWITTLALPAFQWRISTCPEIMRYPYDW